MNARFLWHLNESDEVPLWIFFRCNQLTTTNVPDILQFLCTPVEQILQVFPDVADMIVTYDAGHPLVETIGV